MEHLIPDQWFVFLASKNIWLIFLVLAVSFYALFKGADWFVDGSVEIAKKLGIPKIIIGATIVSLGTTSAEVAVSVMAAFAGQPGLAIGNGIGSVICDTALIFGLCCCISTLPVDKFILNRHGWVQFGSGVGFSALCYLLLIWGITFISPLVGVLLLCGLGIYLFYSVIWARQHNGESTNAEVPEIKFSPGKSTLVFLLGLVFVIVGSRILIGCVNQICLRFGIPEAVIAATVVAFGTSLPELATAIASILKGHKEILIGNILGADILNILFVIGAASLAGKLDISPVIYKLHLPTMILVLIVFRVFSLTKAKQYRRWYGVPLLAIYIAYIYIQYFTGYGK